MHGPIARIRQRLKEYPDARIEEGEGWIAYVPSSPDGFDVEFKVDRRDYTVSFDRWHEHFEDVDEALNCFAFGLSDRCRLRIVSRGRVAHKWIVESLVEGQWIVDSETGLLLFPFWRQPRVSYRQNSLIRSA